MKSLLLFAGLPGVGKSTISNTVRKKTDVELVDIDDFKKTIVDPALVKSQIDPPDLRWEYYQKALRYAFSLFDQGVKIVMMDEVFHLHSLRKQIETACFENEVQVQWVEVRCSYHVVEKRLESTARDGHLLSTEEALKMHLLFMEMFEKFPPDSKNHIIVDNESPINEDLLVEEILGKCV